MEASEDGTRHQDQQEDQQEGPKRSMPRFGPPSLGLGPSLGSSLMLYDTSSQISAMAPLNHCSTAPLLYCSTAPCCLDQGPGFNTPMVLKARRIRVVFFVGLARTVPGMIANIRKHIPQAPIVVAVPVLYTGVMSLTTIRRRVDRGHNRQHRRHHHSAESPSPQSSLSSSSASPA